MEIDTDELEKQIMAALMADIEDEEILEEESDLDNELEFSEDKKKAIDSKIVKCKKCLRDPEEWISTGHFPNGTKKWRDEDGLICNGRICGKCNADRSKTTMRKTRAERDEYYDNL